MLESEAEWLIVKILVLHCQILVTKSMPIDNESKTPVRIFLHQIVFDSRDWRTFQNSQSSHRDYRMDVKWSHTCPSVSDSEWVRARSHLCCVTRWWGAAARRRRAAPAAPRASSARPTCWCSSWRWCWRWPRRPRPPRSRRPSPPSSADAACTLRPRVKRPSHWITIKISLLVLFFTSYAL